MYANTFLINNYLLAEVKQRADIDFDDNHGLRTTSAIENLKGIDRFSLGISDQEDIASVLEFKHIPITEQEYTQNLTIIADSVLYLHLSARDILGNEQVCEN